VRGSLTPFTSALTTEDYYHWGGVNPFSFGPPAGDPAPVLPDDASHLCFLDGAVGLSVLNVLN